MARTKRYQRLGARIRQAREDAGLSRELLAVTTHTSYSSIVNYELGEQEPRFTALARIAAVTDKPLDWFAEAVVERPLGGADHVTDGGTRASAWNAMRLLAAA
jgi:transcriptional regulator with XRE-family HTH domain